MLIGTGKRRCYEVHFHPELAGSRDVRVSPAIWPVRACGRFTALGGGHTAESVGSHYAFYGDKPDICLLSVGDAPTTQTLTQRLKNSEDEHGTERRFNA